MSKSYYIRKSSGQKERYSKKKLEKSLQYSGAELKLREHVSKNVSQRLKSNASTDDIHKAVLTCLQKENPAVACRYHLRRAIFNLGPSGYPFEDYMARVLNEYGYETALRQIVRGKCVEHELDIVAHKDDQHVMIECKFHNSMAKHTDVKVALYMYARFLDLKARPICKRKNEKDVIWIITNTRFTKEAIIYAKCMGMKMTAWKYAGAQSLERLVEDRRIYPITIFPWLKSLAIENFVRQGVVLARQVLDLSPAMIRHLGQLNIDQAQKLKKEAELLLIK